MVDEEIIAVDGIGSAHLATVPRKPVTARSTLQQTVDADYGLDEVLALSDRVAVMFEGRDRAVMDTAEATVERIGLLMAGSELVTEAS
jgi:simple sugar transport system ATP-binding protein